MFVPREEGIKLVAEALGCDTDKVKVATARDVQALITTEKIPAGINALLPKDKSKTLLVCMAGGTSLRVAEVLTKNGVGAQSLTGGIMNLSQTSNRQPEDLVQVATDRKSTRLNSSHSQISYAVFCLKKKNQQTIASPHIQHDSTTSHIYCENRALP